MTPRPQTSRAAALAARFLGRADKTASELRAHLAAKGIDEETVDQVVASLERERFVDDTRVAARETELAKDRRRLGREGLAARLEARGVAPQAAQAETTAYSPAEERRVADELLRLRFPNRDQPAKAARFLASRGFDEETVREAIEAYYPDHEP